MLLNNKNILLVSPESWDHIFVSKHHYAIHLASKNNSVYFLNPPSNTTSVEETPFENVYTINYRGFIKGLRFLPSFYIRKQLLKTFKDLEKLCGVSFDIIWSFDNSVFYDFEALPESVLKICHIVDLNQNFQTERAAKTADICFAVTNQILKRLQQYNESTYFINHGYNVKAQPGTRVTLPGKNTIKIVYAGNLSMQYLDWEILFTAAQSLEDADFVFIGPNKEHSTPDEHHSKFKEQLFGLKNVFAPGKVEAGILSLYYKEASILIVAYQEEYQEEQSNPHKMMEYLGSGKPIVATKTKEYKLLAENELIAMSDKNDDYPDLLTSVVNNLEDWNDASKVNKRIQFALDHTYEKQIEKIDNLLTTHE